MSMGGHAGGYVVPSYRAPDDTPWYHFLHGNVPGHQIDFMYRPEVPQGQLSRQHFSHLARLMKYIEPQTNAPFAFAIGNLSRDDTQYEPGHGGVALMFGLRIKGAMDHAGRQDPPFAHAIAAVDRDLDYTTLIAAATVFHRRVLGAAEAAEWYRAYVRCATESPAEVENVLAGYVESFRGLPEPPWSSMRAKWLIGKAQPPKRVVIVHDNNLPFDSIAHCAAKIAAMLYRSDIRWTSISNGREADLPNGVSIRLIAERHFVPTDDTENVRRLQDVPEDEGELAMQLFGAKPAEKSAPKMLDWRERYHGPSVPAFDPAMVAEAVASGATTLPVERPTSGESRQYRPPSRPPSSSDASLPVGRGSRPGVGSSPFDEDPTKAQGWRAELAQAKAASVEEDVDIPVESTDTIPAALVADPPAKMPPVVSSMAGALQSPVQAAAVPVPLPGHPAALNGVGARPGTGPKGTRVMPAPHAIAQAATTVPLPVVVPPVVALPPVTAKPDWEPPPDFRKPKSPGLRWGILGLLIGAALVAGWVVFSQANQQPDSSGGAPTAPVTNPGVSAAPVPPPQPPPVPAMESAAPSAPPTAPPAKSAATETTGKPKTTDKPGGTAKPPPSKTGAPIIGGPAVF